MGELEEFAEALLAQLLVETNEEKELHPTLQFIL